MQSRRARSRRACSRKLRRIPRHGRCSHPGRPSDGSASRRRSQHRRLALPDSASFVTGQTPPSTAYTAQWHRGQRRRSMRPPAGPGNAFRLRAVDRSAAADETDLEAVRHLTKLILYCVAARSCRINGFYLVRRPLMRILPVLALILLPAIGLAQPGVPLTPDAQPSSLRVQITRSPETSRAGSHPECGSDAAMKRRSPLAFRSFDRSILARCSHDHSPCLRSRAQTSRTDRRP